VNQEYLCNAQPRVHLLLHYADTRQQFALAVYPSKTFQKPVGCVPRIIVCQKSTSFCFKVRGFWCVGRTLPNLWRMSFSDEGNECTHRHPRTTNAGATTHDGWGLADAGERCHGVSLAWEARGFYIFTVYLASLA
jgi:hypothetical protein